MCMRMETEGLDSQINSLKGTTGRWVGPVLIPAPTVGNELSGPKASPLASTGLPLNSRVNLIAGQYSPLRDGQ